MLLWLPGLVSRSGVLSTMTGSLRPDYERPMKFWPPAAILQEALSLR
jgi:hypothetical protein